MFNKLFGKKNDGFYLQVEDDAKPTPKVAAKAKDQVKAAPAAATKLPSAVAEVRAVASVPVATATKAEAKAEQKAKKAEAKAEKKSIKESTPKAEKTVKAAPMVSAPPAQVVPAIKNFATDYLIKPSSNSSRRRPGANMNMFLDLARQVQKPANIK